MAEAPPKKSQLSESCDKSTIENLECAVCLQPCIHPAQLPCGHIFCFLCVKGIANQSKRCAMCRQEIPRDFIDQPTLLNKQTLNEGTESFDGGYQWFYEGRNGWWQYDPRTSEDIEQAYKLNLNYLEIIICGWWQYDERTSMELEMSYKQGEKTCEVLIAGFLYVIDFENMLQLRRNDPSRRRNIKRDFSTIPKKGIAGLRTGETNNNNNNNNNNNTISEPRPIEGRTDNIVPVTPSNTPQTPISGRESPQEESYLQATIERISSLHLADDNHV